MTITISPWNLLILFVVLIVSFGTINFFVVRRYLKTYVKVEVSNQIVQQQRVALNLTLAFQELTKTLAGLRESMDSLMRKPTGGV